MTPPSREYRTGLAEAGRAQEEDISYTGIGKRLPLRLVSKDEASAKEGAKGIQGRLTLEGNVWGTGEVSCGQRRGNILNLFQVPCDP